MINEISKGLAVRYADKALASRKELLSKEGGLRRAYYNHRQQASLQKSVGNTDMVKGHTEYADKLKKAADDTERKYDNRGKGIIRVGKKLAREEVELQEISPAQLAAFADKAATAIAYHSHNAARSKDFEGSMKHMKKGFAKHKELTSMIRSVLRNNK